MNNMTQRVLMTLILAVSLHFMANAQGIEPDPDVPLDPASWLLVAAGVGYGVKRWKDAKHPAKEKDVL